MFLINSRRNVVSSKLIGENSTEWGGNEGKMFGYKITFIKKFNNSFVGRL